MKVLATTPTFFPIVGGAELLIRDVLNVWAEDHEVRLLTPNLRGDSRPYWIEDAALEGSCDFEVRRFDDRVNLLKLRGHRSLRGLIPPMSLTAASVIGREAKEMNADLLVGFFGIPYGLSLALVSARLKIPYLLVMCGTDLPSPRTSRVPLWGDYLRFTTSRADKVVYVSRFCFDVLSRKPFATEHDQVIFGGVHDQRSTGGAGALRQQLGIADNDIMLFALQRLGPEKRVDVLLRALAALPPLEQRVWLVVGGQGPEASMLSDIAAELGVGDRVIFTGHLGAEKDLYYEACDIFVFHSLFETFGQVLVEAMWAGKPIVSVRAGAIPEVVEEGRTGLLADPQDPVLLAQLIAQLVREKDRRLRLGRAGRARAEQLFDWTGTRRQWKSLLVSEAPVVVAERVVSAAGLNARTEE